MKINGWTQLLILISLIYDIFTKDYKYQTYDSITSTFKELEISCPNYIKLDTSQNRYGLPSAGTCGRLNQACENLIVFMTDFKSMHLGRPQMYISGLLHGDEVMGANVMTALAIYVCKTSNIGSNDDIQWVKDILKKVYIVFTPFTNSYGFAHKEREDVVRYNNGQVGYIDPNRDFPYFDFSSPFTDLCMRTITARTINELFNEHLFLNTITFHGGLNAIGYPWGNNIHLVTDSKGTEAPDYEALRQIGELMLAFSKSKSQKNYKKIIPDYQLGDMDETVSLN
jgi:hypothetical protein